MEASKNEMREKNIIFFDGVCHLCNSFVDRLIRADTKRKFSFAPLQGTTAQKLLGTTPNTELQSVVYFRPGESSLHESDAILQILQDLGGSYKLAVIFKIFPGAFRDVVYRWVARHRYQWFGQRDFCRLPNADEKKFLLP